MTYLIRITASLSLACAMLLAVQTVSAKDDMMDGVQARFTAADKNHDGKLSKEEAKAGMPRVAQYFDQIDADHTGYVTFEQIADFIAGKQKQKH